MRNIVKGLLDAHLLDEDERFELPWGLQAYRNKNNPEESNIPIRMRKSAGHRRLYLPPKTYDLRQFD
ncbi:MAG: hypothetical protein ACK2TV_04810 [Anaerolineales bacterium]